MSSTMRRTLTQAQWIDEFVLRLGEFRKDLPLGELIEIASNLWSVNRYLPPAEVVRANYIGSGGHDELSVVLYASQRG
jgi:hypothetical protein